MCPKGTCLFRVYYLPIERSREKELDSSQPILSGFETSEPLISLIAPTSGPPPPLSLFYHLPPRLLPLSRFHLVRFICPMHALARLRARIMVKLRKEASTRKLVCPFKRPRVKWTFDCMVYNALNRLARILFIAFYSVEIDIIGGYLNREIGQHCWHVNWQYTMLPPGMEVICVCIYICQRN